MSRATIWWWLHNVVAHGVLMGFTGENSKLAVWFHDYTAGNAPSGSKFRCRKVPLTASGTP